MSALREITATAYLLKPEEGGRDSGIVAGYRPNFMLGASQSDGAIYPTGKERMEPGDECEIRVRLLHAEAFGDQLRPGALLRFREGNRVVGFGVIRQVV